mgnify:FL=1
MSTGTKVNVIGESSSTRTEWTLVEGERIVEHAITSGLNPYFHSRRGISHIIRLELPEAFFKRRWNHIYYYGAGCSNPEKIKIVEASLVAQFKTPVTVMSDLLGAARGLLVNEPGLACILGTGSNSCLYNGRDIVKNVRPLGFILGDEGSGASLGRIFLGDALKGFAPKEVTQAFYERFKLSPDELLDEIYNNPAANQHLRAYGLYLSEHLDNEYVREIIFNDFNRFFERNVCQYDYAKYPACFVGTIATAYSDILLDVAGRHGVTVKKIIRSSMPGLVTYHATND